MPIDKMHIRHCMLYEFNFKKKKVSQATKSICSAYSDEVLDVQTCQNWFARFKAGDFDLNDRATRRRPKSDQPKNFLTLTKLVNKTFEPRIKKKRPYKTKGKRKVILLHDNARPYVTKTTKDVIENIDWGVLPHLTLQLIHQTWYLVIIICSGRCSTSSVIKKFSEAASIKKEVSQFFFISNRQAFMRKESVCYQKDGRWS